MLVEFVQKRGAAGRSDVRVEDERVERSGWTVNSWPKVEWLEIVKCVVFYSFRYFELVECFENVSIYG